MVNYDFKLTYSTICQLLLAFSSILAFAISASCFRCFIHLLLTLIIFQHFILYFVATVEKVEL